MTPSSQETIDEILSHFSNGEDASPQFKMFNALNTSIHSLFRILAEAGVLSFIKSTTAI
jgi:hypothetical protein